MENIGFKYFFDTYAFCEFINGNERYKKYFKNNNIITNKLCLTELFYILLKNFDLETARKYFKEFNHFCIEVPDIVIEKAMLFRFESKNKGLSYADCIGYELAKFNNLKFLTGDKQFKDLKNVEYVI